MFRKAVFALTLAALVGVGIHLATAQGMTVLKDGTAWGDADASPLLHSYRAAHGADRTDVIGWMEINKTEATAVNAQLVAASINKVVWYFGQRQ